MSSSSSKGKSSTGLRILWIPGKKKQNRKGVYNATKLPNAQYHSYQLKKNEPWSLGGIHGQTKLIHTDIAEHVGTVAATSNLIVATSTTSAITSISSEQSPLSPPPPPATVDEGTNTTEDECSVEKSIEIPTSNHYDVLHEEGEEDPNISHGSSILSSNDNKSTDTLNNTATLAIGERRRNGAIKRGENLDSIEHLADHDGVGDSTTALNQFKKKSKKKKKKKDKSQDKEGKDPEDDKLVTCLYYSLICCDCTIS